MDSVGSDAAEPSPTIGPDGVTIAALDQSYSAYISCLRPQLDGVMRVNFERYAGIAGEMSLPDGRNDSALIEDIDAECQSSSMLEDRLLSFASRHSLTAAQVEAVTADVAGCLRAAGNAFADELLSQAPGSIDDLFVVTSQIPYPDDPEAGQALLGCVQTSLYGDPTEF